MKKSAKSWDWKKQESKKYELGIGCPVTGPVEINWKDRQSVMRAISVPGLSQALLGLLPLEEMDLVVHPGKHELVGAHGDTIEYIAFYNNLVYCF